MHHESPYLLANAAAEAGERFAALSATFDPTTFGHLDARGIGPGWTCWEVGAGGPSVPGWLAGRVGPTGRVVATDIDTTWLTDLPALVGAGLATATEVEQHLAAVTSGRIDLATPPLVTARGQRR